MITLILIQVRRCPTCNEYDNIENYKYYDVLVISFVKRGCDGYNTAHFVKDQNNGISVDDKVIDYIQKADSLGAANEKRIIHTTLWCSL